MQRQFLTAKDEVFANGDLVYLFKCCFTVRKFALNKKFMRFARRNQVDIVPVAVRGNVNLRKLQKASYASVQLPVCDIEWPADIDPTIDANKIVGINFDVNSIANFVVNFSAAAADAAENMHKIRIMTKMLDMQAAAVRRLQIRMSLDTELHADVDPIVDEHIHNFLNALAKCTGMETLIITETNHVAKNANLNSIQCKVFEIIKTMHKLKVLDFCGNMTLDAPNPIIDTTHGTQNQLTMIDYLPASLSELILRDGSTLKTLKWKQWYGFSAGICLLMSNDADRFPLLKSLSMPSSFWSLTWFDFRRFVIYLNSNHITTIRVSDPFKLNKRPFKPAAGGAPIQKTKIGLHYLIAELVHDMVIDIRGADEAERAKRIQWAMEITTSSVIQPIQRSDGAGYTTITMDKKSNCTVQVLI